MTEAMKNIDLRKVDKSTLRDRGTVRIDPEAPTEERIRAWIKQLGNPYSCPVPTGLNTAQTAPPRSTAAKRRKVSGGAEGPVWTIRGLKSLANQGVQVMAQQGADTFPLTVQNYDFRR